MLQQLYLDVAKILSGREHRGAAGSRPLLSTPPAPADCCPVSQLPVAGGARAMASRIGTLLPRRRAVLRSSDSVRRARGGARVQISSRGRGLDVSPP
jgi:hypothetical protein